MWILTDKGFLSIDCLYLLVPSNYAHGFQLTFFLWFRREECVQLRTVLANVSLSDNEPLSSFSKTGKIFFFIKVARTITETNYILFLTGELPEAEELMAAYETQKVVIAQLQEQIYDEKMRNTEIETDLRDELDR